MTLKCRKITMIIRKNPTRKQTSNQTRRPQNQMKSKRAPKLLMETNKVTVREQEVAESATEAAIEVMENLEVATEAVSTVAVVVEEATLEVLAKIRTVSS